MEGVVVGNPEPEVFSPAGVVVTEGLQPGQWIVTAGVHSLEEGQTVRILDEE